MQRLSTKFQRPKKHRKFLNNTTSSISFTPNNKKIRNKSKFSNPFFIDNDDENAGDDEILPIPTFSIGAFHKLVESYWVNGLHADLSKYTDPSQLIDSYAVIDEYDKSKTVLPKFLTVSEIVGQSKPQLNWCGEQRHKKLVEELKINGFLMIGNWNS